MGERLRGLAAKSTDGRRGVSGPQTEMLLKLELQSNPEALCLVRAAVERTAEVMKFPEADRRAIVRSVDEALANVMRHAYEGRPGQPIEVSCVRVDTKSTGGNSSGIEIVLQDEGKAVDPEKLKGRPLNEIRPGGLGLHLIKQSMDVVEFSRKNGKNQLRMVKYLRPAPQPAGSEGE